VSRALNHKGYVSSGINEAILSAVKALNYTPNLAAKSLKLSRTNQLMLSINSVRDYYTYDVIESFIQVAHKNGFTTLINYTNDDEAQELRLLDRLKQNFVDGLIMITLNFTEKHLQLINEANYPVVLSSMSNHRLDFPVGKYDYVGVDTEIGTYMSTKHLIRLGRRRVGYAGLPIRTQAWDERLKGYQQAMRDNKCDMRDEWIITGGYDDAFGYRAGVKLVTSGGLPEAVCASTDMIAIGLYRAFEEYGVRIPEDVAVTGMDNTAICDLLRPKLTSVSIKQADVGRAATELIISRLNGLSESYKNVIFQPSLVVRQSCGSK